MLGNNKGILDNPRILREESVLRGEPVKKGKGWLFKLILFLVVIGLVLYLFTHPDIIRDAFDKLLGKLLK